MNFNEYEGMKIGKTLDRLVGIVFPFGRLDFHHSSFVLQPGRGLNVVYGKNGGGKSSVINGLKNRQETQSLRSFRDYLEIGQRSSAEMGNCTCYINISDSPYISVAQKAAVEVGSLIENKRRGTKSLNYAYPVAWGGGKSELAEDFIKKTSHVPRHGHEEIIDGLNGFFDEVPLEEIKRICAHGSFQLQNSGASLTELLVGLTYQYMMKEIRPDSHEFELALADELSRFFESSGVFVNEVNQKFEEYLISCTLDYPKAVIDDDEIKNLSLKQKLELNVYRVVKLLEGELFETLLDYELFDEEICTPELEQLHLDDELTFGALRDDAPLLVSLIGNALALETSNPVIAIKRERGERAFQASLALDLRNFVQLDSSLGHEDSEFRSITSLIKALSHEDSGTTIEDKAIFAWRIYSRLFNTILEESEFDMFEHDDFPYVMLGFRIDLNSDAVEFRSFGDTIDVEAFAREAVGAIVQQTQFDGLILSGERFAEIEIDKSLQKEIDLCFGKLSEFLSSLGIGIDSCFVTLSGSVIDWLSGESTSLLFEVGNQEKQFGQLSAAQQFWVCAGIQILAATNSATSVVLVADEPDGGLHERAANNVMNVLQSTGLDFIVSSHSVAALRTRDATFHHLERDVNGDVRLTRMSFGEDVLTLAEKFGTTTYDLLSLKRLMVVVEGSHDAVVVNRLLALSGRPHLSDLVLTAPVRGVMNVTSIADSVLLTEFSELNILVVVDNGRESDFQKLVDTLRTMSSEGNTISQQKAVVAKARSSSSDVFEERFLFDLLDRAVHRGLLRRLSIFALPTPDIVDLLPPELFGLEQSWEQLRSEYRKDRSSMNFKDWLRESRNVSISEKTIQSALDQSDALDPVLLRLLQEIELACK
jgi:hypothetical protein